MGAKAKVHHDFPGFGEEERRAGDIVMRRRVIELEQMVQEMRERMGEMEKAISTLTADVSAWQSAYDTLHKKLVLNEKKDSRL